MEGRQGEGDGLKRREEQGLLKPMREGSRQPRRHGEAASLCLLSTQNVCLSRCILSPLTSQEGTQSNRLQHAINVSCDSIRVQHTIMYCNYTKPKEWDKVLPVTVVKIKLTTKKGKNPRNKKISLSKFIMTLDNIPKKKSSQVIVLACCSSLP